MGVVITDRRSIYTEADDHTVSWVGAGDTVTDSFAEGPASVAEAYNIATGTIYYPTGTSIDLSNSLVYVYSQVVATQDSWVGGVHSLYIGDGTNNMAWHMQGNDRRVFSHSDGPVGWSNFVIDGSVIKTYSSSTELTAIDGSLASLNLAATTRIGAHFITLSKALGGGNNCYVDIIRFGNNGILVTSGTSGNPGDFLDVCIEDRDTATLKGHGVIRELSTQVYSIQSPITIGDSGGTTASYFRDTGAILAYENRQINDDKYFFKVEGNSSATNEFGLTGSTISSSGPQCYMEFNSGNINDLGILNCTFSNLGRTIKFSSAADASNHTVRGCTFNECGVVTIGEVGFSSNTVTNSTLYGPQSAATHMNSGAASGTTKGISLTNYNGGYGLYIDSGVTGTISLTDWEFDHSGTYDIYWAGTVGTLTINLGGTSNPTSWTGAGGTVNLVSTTDYTLTGLKYDVGPPTAATEVRIYLSGATDDYTTVGGEIYGVEDVTGGTITYQYGTDIISSGHNCIVMIHNVNYETIRYTVDLLGTDTIQQIQQQFDRNYNNPT